MIVYVCEDSLEGILCGVYDAWNRGGGHEDRRLELAGQGETMELFSEYVDVPVVEEKAEKVIRSVRSKISEEAYELIYKASLSLVSNRADRIYRFLICGFRYGSDVTAMLQLPAVCDVFEICRYVDREAHLTKEFVRFSEMSSGLLVSRIKPKNDVLVLLASHFADRLSGENWMIYDEGRKKAILHRAGCGWAIMPKVFDGWENAISRASGDDDYVELWKAFRSSVAIWERRNPVCQRNLMPLRYRVYMPEFAESLYDSPPVRFSK